MNIYFIKIAGAKTTLVRRFHALIATKSSRYLYCAKVITIITEISIKTKNAPKGPK